MRFPGKVLKDLPLGSGISVLEQIVRRLKRSKLVGKIVIATSKEKDDEPIVRLAEKLQVKCYRGSKEDVLSRFYEAARENSLDIVVRITGDCPCIDPAVVDLTIQQHLENHSDYTTNVLSQTFPRGSEAEVINFSALETAHRQARETFEREHVTPFIYKSRRDLFNIKMISAPSQWAAPDLRLTLDTAQDYILLCAVYDLLYSGKPDFGLEDVIQLFRKKPWLAMINDGVIQKKVCTTLEEEIEEAARILDRQDLLKAKEWLTSRH